MHEQVISKEFNLLRTFLITVNVQQMGFCKEAISFILTKL